MERVLDWNPQPPYTAEQLLQVIRILRDPENGCPWDKVQTHASIRKNFLEETCEALEAIDADDAVLLREELGDVLMQGVFHAAMEEERGRFTFEDVCRNVCEKLVFRHPNIFASSAAENAGINGWDALKNKEKGRTTLADELATVPATLPALMRAQKLQKRAAGHGLGQQDAAAAQHRLETAVQAFGKAEDTAKQEAAGQLLFAAVNAARLAGVDAEEALTFASKRYCAELLAQKEQSGTQVECRIEILVCKAAFPLHFFVFAGSKCSAVCGGIPVVEFVDGKALPGPEEHTVRVCAQRGVACKVIKLNT